MAESLLPSSIVETAVDAILADDEATLFTKFRQLDGLPPAAKPYNIAEGLTLAPTPLLHGIDWSVEEIRDYLLKIALIDPDLYNNLREVFVDHNCPEKLDSMGGRIRDFFLTVNQKEETNGESQENQTDPAC